MRILSLEAENFRNIKNAALSFCEGVNLLHGENAQGKTNALEAVYFFARGRSFRTADERELCRFGAPGFRIGIRYLDRAGEQKLEYAVFGREKKRAKNGVKLAKITEMLGHFRAVLFTPDDLGMVKDGPEERRAFLNVAISQCFPSYIPVYGRYKTLLENRNALLRAAKLGKPVDASELLAFSDGMAESAARIRAYRQDYIARLGVYAAKFLSELSDGKEEMTVGYDSDLDPSITDAQEATLAYREVFSREIEREKAVGTSLYGVQRDDMEICIGGVSARNFASQGQQRSAVLALKLAEGEVSREISGDYPVFLFDDVMSELDEKRRAYLLTAAKNRQMILTSCETREELLRRFGQDVRVFDVENGEYLCRNDEKENEL